MNTRIRNKNKNCVIPLNNGIQANSSRGGFVRLVKNGVVTRVRKSCMHYTGQLIHSIKYSLHNTFVTKRTTPFSTTGFVILFAVLASTLILAMAVGIFNVAYKEQVLGNTTKASAYADAAANVGLECALYNDIKKHLFPDPNFPLGVPDATGALVPISTPGTINCVGPDDWNINPNGNIYTFTIETDEGYGIVTGNASIDRTACVKVFVNKNEAIGSEILTHVVSRGYNVACDKLEAQDDGTINPRIVERRSEVRYNSKGVPGGGLIATADIWATRFGESPVGQGPGGGSISVENNGEGQYDISWSSSNVSSCTESVSPASFGFPQNTANDIQNITINPGNDGVTPGTYVYTINCIDLDGNAVPPQTVSVVVFENTGGGSPPSANIWVTGDAEANFDTDGNISLTLAQSPYVIHWSNPSGDANSCSVNVSGGDDHISWPQTGTSGTQTINVVSDMQGVGFTYSVLCSNTYGSDSDSVDVTIAPSGGTSSARMSLYGRADGSPYLLTSPGFPPPSGTGSPLGTSAYWQSNFGVFHILTNSFDVRTSLGNIDLNSCATTGTYHRWAMADVPIEAGTAWDNATFVAYNGVHTYSFNLTPPTPGSLVELNLVCSGSLPPFSIMSKSVHIQLP